MILNTNFELNPIYFCWLIRTCFVCFVLQIQEVSPPAAAREKLWTPVSRLRRGGDTPNMAVWWLKCVNNQSQLMASKWGGGGRRAYCESDGTGCSQLYQCTLHVFPLHTSFLGLCLHGCGWTRIWYKAREEETLSRENQTTHFTYSSVFIHIMVVVPIFDCLFYSFIFFKFPNLLEFWLTPGLNLPASVTMITKESLTCY